MKTRNIVWVALVAAFTLSSCTKCMECHDCVTAPEICRNEYNSNDEYQDAIDAAEDFGCSCKPKLKPS